MPLAVEPSSAAVSSSAEATALGKAPEASHQATWDWFPAGCRLTVPRPLERLSLCYKARREEERRPLQQWMIVSWRRSKYHGILLQHKLVEQDTTAATAAMRQIELETDALFSCPSLQANLPDITQNNNPTDVEEVHNATGGYPDHNINCRFTDKLSCSRAGVDVHRAWSKNTTISKQAALRSHFLMWQHDKEEELKTKTRIITTKLQLILLLLLLWQCLLSSRKEDCTPPTTAAALMAGERERGVGGEGEGTRLPCGSCAVNRVTQKAFFFLASKYLQISFFLKIK